jgi:hypothetical protein
MRQQENVESVYASAREQWPLEVERVKNRRFSAYENVDTDATSPRGLTYQVLCPPPPELLSRLIFLLDLRADLGFGHPRSPREERLGPRAQ